MKFNEYPYERPDFEKTKTKSLDFLRQIKNAENMQEILDAVNKYINMVLYINSMNTISDIRHSIDNSDTFYNRENDWWDEYIPYFLELNTQYYKVISSSPFLKDLKAVFPDTYFKIIENKLMTFDEKIINDLQEENKLVSSYNRIIASAGIPFDDKILNLAQLKPYTESPERKIRMEATQAQWDFFKKHESEFDDIYDKLVKIRDKMARKLGYKNYVEMGYKRMNRFDYDEKMVVIFRRQVLNEVVPVANKLYNRQAKRIGVDKIKYYDINLHFIDGNAVPVGTYEDTIEKGRKMYHELSTETSEFIDHMLDNGLMDLIAKPGKESGGYMTFLFNTKSPFIFANFNGTSSDVDVLTHEAGHAFQGYQSRNINLPEVLMPTHESCEIHSMSMEFITWPYMEYFFGKKADKYRYSHLSESVKFIPYGVLVDHFQHEVYHNPNMTPEQRKKTWRTLEKQYRPHIDYDGNEFAEKGTWWYRQGHIFQTPFYYIDYTLAQVCAFQFWKRIHIDNDSKAWDDYLKICKIGGTQSFTQIVKTANLISPFEEGCLKKVIHEIDHLLETIDDTKL